MAQTGYTPILIYSSSTAAAAPAAGSLTNSTLGSELAINITDGKLFYKDNANAVQVIGWKTVPTTAGGTGLTSYTAGDLTYYASGTTLTKLAIGSNTTVLTSSGTAPQWTAQSSLSVGTASNLLSNATTGVMQITGPGAGTTRVMTIPDANFTAARTDAAQNFIGNNTFDTTLLVIDATNDRVGVGTGTPVTRFEARGVDAIARFRGSSTQYLDIIATAGGSVALDANNGVLALSVNTVERARFFSSGGVSIGDTTDPGAGNLRLGTGNLVIGTSGKGIDFSATPGTGTSELLADYEEGTWTPTATGGLTVNSAAYTKVGRQVTITADVTAVSTTSGDISGLPFTNGARNGSGVVGYQTETATVTWGLIIDASSTNMSFRLGATQQQLSTGKRAYFSAVYFV